jgi:hypothetical protein
MTQKDFKKKYIENLRYYLPDKDVKIVMRIAKKNERCYYDDDNKSVRNITYLGKKWYIALNSEIKGISSLMYYAMYKTLDVSWDYKGK